MITGTVLPTAPDVGVIEVTAGGSGGLTVKFSALLAPAVVVTIIGCAASVAVKATLNVAVICVSLTTVTLVAVIPPCRLPLSDAPVKFLPVRVTAVLSP